MRYIINKKIILTAIIIFLVVTGIMGWQYYRDTFVKHEIVQQMEEKGVEKINEEEIKKREEAWEKALSKEGVKAIVHTKVLNVVNGEITAQEIYPYVDDTGKSYPVRTLTLVPLTETTYAKRVYEANSEGLITTNFKDENGSLEEIKPEMFLSAMVIDAPSETKKMRARTIVYFDRFPGIKYDISQEIKNENK